MRSVSYMLGGDFRGFVSMPEIVYVEADSEQHDSALGDILNIGSQFGQLHTVGQYGQD